MGRCRTFVGVGSGQYIAVMPPHDPFAYDSNGGGGLPCSRRSLHQDDLLHVIHDLRDETATEVRCRTAAGAGACHEGEMAK